MDDDEKTWPKADPIEPLIKLEALVLMIGLIVLLGAAFSGVI